MHNETLSVIVMRSNNPDRPPLKIDGLEISLKLNRVA